MPSISSLPPWIRLLRNSRNGSYPCPSLSRRTSQGTARARQAASKPSPRLSVSLGLGVLFSSVPVFVYQGLLALLAHVIAPLLSDAAIAEITCCGSVMILAIGLNMLHLTKIKTADLLPAVLFAPVLTWAFSFLPL